MQPSKSSFSVSRISAGSVQLLVGPASSCVSEQMKVRSSTRATSPGIGQRQVGVGPLGVGQPLEGARVHQLLRQLVVLLGRAVAPVHGIRPGEGGDLLHPRLELLVLRGHGGLCQGGAGSSVAGGGRARYRTGTATGGIPRVYSARTGSTQSRRRTPVKTPVRLLVALTALLSLALLPAAAQAAKAKSLLPRAGRLALGRRAAHRIGRQQEHLAGLRQPARAPRRRACAP